MAAGIIGIDTPFDCKYLETPSADDKPGADPPLKTIACGWPPRFSGLNCISNLFCCLLVSR